MGLTCLSSSVGDERYVPGVDGFGGADWNLSNSGAVCKVSVNISPISNSQEIHRNK